MELMKTMNDDNGDNDVNGAHEDVAEDEDGPADAPPVIVGPVEALAQREGDPPTHQISFMVNSQCLCPYIFIVINCIHLKTLRTFK